MNIFSNLSSLASLFTIIVAVVIIDTSILGITPYILENNDYYNTIFFCVLVGISGYCQYKTLRLIKERSIKFSLKKSRVLHLINIIIPLFSIIALVSISTEMLISFAYHSILVKIIIWVSYGLGVTNMLLLSYYFFQWFQFSKSYLIISYLISIIALSINLTTALLAITEEQFNEAGVITSIRVPVMSISTVYNIFNSLFDYTTVISFVLLWISSILLLIHYQKKYGPVLFGIFFLIPLLYFVSRFVPFFSDFFLDLSFNYPDQAQIIYTIIISSGKPIGGFLFGLVFWIASRNITIKLVKEYLVIAGYGIMLLFTSNQVMSLVSLDYPPFGIITVSFLSLASYLVFIGIYSSSIYVAESRELRNTLRRSKEKQQNLMSQIGSAHMQKNLVKTAENVMKKMADATGVEHLEDEDDYKKYIEEAVREIQKEKKD